jgi:hypothetical protein
MKLKKGFLFNLILKAIKIILVKKVSQPTYRKDKIDYMEKLGRDYFDGDMVFFVVN